MKLLRNCKKPLTRLAVLHSGYLSPGFTKLTELENLFQPLPSIWNATPRLNQTLLLHLLAICNYAKYISRI